MTPVYDLAARYVAERAKLDPIFATTAGIAGYDRALPDYSPDGIAAQLALHKRYRADMAALSSLGRQDDIAKRVFDERVQVAADSCESGDELRRLATMQSPMQEIREAFDLLPRDTTEQWKTVAARMTAVPQALASFVAGLREGQHRGLSASRRQALACAHQARVWSGYEDGARYFESLLAEFQNRGTGDRKVEDALRNAANSADAAYGELATFLVDEYAPKAPEADAVGRERYVRTGQDWLGLNLDVDGAYQWGWEELRRVRREIAEVCEQIAPGLPYREVVAQLDGDHERLMHGEQQLQDWIGALMSRTIDRLNGVHFDIPAELQRIEVRIAPRGVAASQYYLAPSNNFVRPGTYWFPTSGRTRFPIWNEISTAYHEGVPGHHLMEGYQVWLRDELSDYQRHLHVAGHAEGWSMYAERLMGELGYFDRPEYYLDMLSNSLLRAARVVVDIGLHVGLPIPDDEPEFGGQPWSVELATQFLLANCNESPQFVASEINRYLGLPGQALTYKLGEAVWLEARKSAQKRFGDAFDLRQFHTDALNLGPMGLGHLRDLLVRD